MNRVMKILWTIVIYLLFITPAVTYLLFGKYLPALSGEYRTLAEFPELTLETFKTYPEKLDEYINDHLPYRAQLIRFNGQIDMKVFDVSPSEKVIIGKEDWLFYSDVTDGDPLADYTGTNLFDENQLASLAERFTAIDEALKQEGKEFVLYFAPNKERVYSEYMPDRYGSPSVGQIGQLYSYLKENTNIRIVYCYDDLMQWKNENSDRVIYLQKDTHWNNLGAYIGTRTLLQELGVDLPSPDELEITSTQQVAGDLARLINLPIHEGISDDFEISGIPGEDTVVLTGEEGDQIYSCENTGRDQRKMAVIHDSFSGRMRQYIGCGFDEAVFFDYRYYAPEMLEEEDPDIVVLEVVERYLDRLLNDNIVLETAKISG